jgi:hypothetical protein
VPFPEFRPGSQKVLFFSRGRGRGHAVIDLELMDTLQRELPDLDVRFVSYAEGARQIADSKRPLIDLGLPAQNSYVETSVLAGRLIGWLQPDFVIAHEEFAVMPSAKIFDKPTLFLTDWFTTPDKLTMAALRLADHILFLDEAGIYEEPATVEGRVTYCGPYLRELRHNRADKYRLREQLQLPPNATVLGVFPGSWREAQTPLADVYVVWIAGDDVDLLREKFAMKPRFLVREYEDPIDAWMAASDLAITKCNRKSAFELLRLGVPSVAVSWGFNPIDDAWVRRHEQICWLSAASLTPADLASYLQCAAALGPGEQPWLSQPESEKGNHQILSYIRDWLRRTQKKVSAGA